MDENEGKKFANQVAELTYKKFKKLPKRGKPQAKKEWTLLASIVMTEDIQKGETPRMKVIALCTGTKCLGRSSMSKNGDVVNDSHAEVLARRAFIRYLFSNMFKLLSGGKSEILERHPSGTFVVKPDVKFHLFISHTPCGDASIFPKEATGNPKRVIDKSTEDEHMAKRLKEDDINLLDNANYSVADQELSSDSTCCMNTNKTKLMDLEYSSSNVSDIFRTGAKCVEGDIQDPKAPGKDYHVTGALRTKPGRGDPTWSMSCSDKIALWNVCGIQGALASHFLSQPIYFSSVIIGKCPFNKAALQRAIIDRTTNVAGLPDGYRQSNPQIFQSDLSFEYSRENLQQENRRTVPCPAAIIWNDHTPDEVDVCVNGRRQGITKKNHNKPSSWVSVCRVKLFEEFLNLLRTMSKDKIPATLRQLTGEISYLQCKKKVVNYQDAKSLIFELFSGWKKKPDTLQMFVGCLNKRS